MQFGSNAVRFGCSLVRVQFGSGQFGSGLVRVSSVRVLFGSVRIQFGSGSCSDCSFFVVRVQFRVRFGFRVRVTFCRVYLELGRDVEMAGELNEVN